MSDNYLYSNLTEKIIKAFYNVYNYLGYGFLEKVYENALMIELRKMGLNCENQKSIKVYYHNYEVGVYFADIVVEEKVIVELKSAESLVKDNELQLVNYLKATDIEVGLLINFGKKPEFKRRVLTAEYKDHNNLRSNKSYYKEKYLHVRHQVHPGKSR